MLNQRQLARLRTLTFGTPQAGPDHELNLETLEERLAFSGSPTEAWDYGAVLPEWFASVEGTTLSPVSDGQGLGAQSTTSNDQSSDSGTQDWVVRFTESATQGMTSVAQTQSLLGEGHTAEVVKGLGLVGQVVVRTEGAGTDAISQWFSSNSNIASFSTDSLLSSQAFADDARYGDLWGLHNTGQGKVDADIDAPEAWEITTGSSNVVVAVIDSGVDYNHPDLVNNMWVNPGEIAGDGIDNDKNGFIDDVHGWDFVDNDNTPMDGNGHGTHVAGTIGAEGNNGSAVTGVNWDVSLMALRTLNDSGRGSSADGIAAINYATMMAERGTNVRVMNASWGGGGRSFTMESAIDKAGDAGILFVAAAGNDSNDNDVSPTYPATLNGDSIISVAATKKDDTLAGYSNYGATTVHLGAPGSRILSTYTGGGVKWLNGTSMAAPHVSGVAALAWAANPDATVAEVRDAILSGVDLLPALEGKTVSGGRLNAYNTLQIITGGDAHGDNAGSASEATTGEVRSGTIGEPGDVDWFSIDVVSGQTYRFQTELVTLPDSVLTLYSSNGTTVLATDDNGGSGLASLIEWTATFTGTVYLEVSAANSSQTGSYRLALASDDHRDDAQGATVITVPGTLSGNLETEGDVDWFAFNAVAGQGYQLSTALQGLSDSTLTLYDTDGVTELAFNDDGGEGLASLMNWVATKNGTFYVQVAGYSTTETGAYQLSLSEYAAPADDHANSASSATPVAWNKGVAGNLEEGGDRDWFSFHATAGKGYVFETQLFGLNDSQLRLYDTDGQTVLASDDNSGSGLASRLDWVATDTGEFFVEVLSPSTTETGTYRLNLWGSSTLDFNDYKLGSYGGTNDENGVVTIENGGAGLRLDGNTWKQINLSYDVTADTVLEFDFRSDKIGEIHGIGFDNNTEHQEDRTFQLSGSQNWGLSNFNNYSGNGWQHFTIPVGQFYTGQMEYLFFVTDDDAGQSSESYFANVNIYEGGMNNPPTATNDTLTVAQNSGPTSVNVLANDTAAPDLNETLTVIGVTQGSNGGSVTINGGTSIDYAPEANFVGTESFSYTISDGNGGTDTATVTVSVTGTNRTPVALADSASSEGSSVVINVLENDYDPDGDLLTISNISQGTSGSVTLNADNTLTYTPQNGFAGIDTFTYTVSDSQGNQATASVTVTITQNVAPTAQSDVATTSEGQAVVIDVLANDTDSNGDPLTISGITQPTNGNVAVNLDGTVTYTPGSGFVGSDSFSYTIDDGQGNQDTATVDVTVTGLSALPTINFNDYTIGSYGGSNDSTGSVSVEDNGATLHLTGNRWKQIDFAYKITAKTVLEFDFLSNTEGEIHGIGFDNNTDHQNNRTFQFYGTQDWGVSAVADYGDSAAGWRHYTIEVGQFYTGNMEYLFFINDDDASASAESYFSNVRVYEAVDPPVEVNFGDYSIDSYGDGNDKTGSATLEDGGKELRLSGNNWKKIDLPYEVTANTILEFDYQSPNEGEIHGIGLDTNTSHQQNRTFQLHGTQGWGIQAFNDYSGTGLKHYKIPVGQFFTGKMENLFFINDDDATSSAQSYFSNIRIYDSLATQTDTSDFSAPAASATETAISTSDISISNRSAPVTPAQWDLAVNALATQSIDVLSSFSSESLGLSTPWRLSNLGSLAPNSNLPNSLASFGEESRLDFSLGNIDRRSWKGLVSKFDSPLNGADLSSPLNPYASSGGGMADSLGSFGEESRLDFSLGNVDRRTWRGMWENLDSGLLSNQDNTNSETEETAQRS